MAELGISGATVLESQGMANVLGKESPVIAGLRHLVTQGRSFNYTILSVVEDDHIADRTMKAIEDHLLPGTKAGTRGIAFTISVEKMVKFHPHGQEVLRTGGETVTSPEPPPPSPSPPSSFQRAMLAALKRSETTPPNLIAKLTGGLRALVEPRHSQELREKRRAPRVSCDYQVTVETDGDSIDGRLVDIGLFGLSFCANTELRVGSVLALFPPAVVGDDAPANVSCRVEQCLRDEDEDCFRYGLVYEESPETLSTSWIAHLLNALGYSMGHLVQRRRLRRVHGPVQAEFQILEDDLSVPASVIDLGVHGALVEAEVDWEKGTEVGLLLGPYEGHEAFYLEGMTVEMRPGEDGSWLHGVRFYTPDSKRLKRLGNLVIDLVKHPLSSSSP